MSEKPYVTEFGLPDGRVITSVVMDREDFETLVDDLVKVEIHGLQLDTIAELKQIGHIPLMARGTKTEFVFERFGVTSKLVSLIIRGQGRRIAEELLAAAQQHMRQQIEMN